MNWLGVALTVALTATTWLGWSDQTPATTVETALVDPSESVDLPPVVRAAQAANDPPVEYDDLIITTRPMGDCVADCEGDFVYPPPPVFTRIVAAVEMHAAANPQYFRNEGMERLYARLGPVNYQIFGGQYLEYDRPNLPLSVPHWEQWSPLRLAAGSSIAWAGVPQGVTTEANGLRHIFTVPGAYTLTATVNAKFDLSMVVRPFCQICWWGRREVVADYKGLAAPALQKTLGVTAVGVGSLELANAGREIDDELTQAGEDRITYLKERTAGAGTVVATAAPTPEVDDTILGALGWSFTGGQPVPDESEYRKRQASTQDAAIHTFAVGWGTPAAMTRVSYIVGIDIVEGGTAVTGTKNSVIGKGMSLSARLVPTGLPFGLGLPTRWDISGNRIKGYTADDEIGRVESLTDEDLRTSTSVHFYWVQAGTNTVKFITSAKGIGLYGNAVFNVKKPTVTVEDPTRNLPFIDYTDKRLRLGRSTNLATSGIAFKAVTSWNDTGITGSTQFVQTACPNRYYSEVWGGANIAHWRYIDQTPRLDTEYPYSAPVSGSSTTTTSGDSPSAPFENNYLTCGIQKETFAMYIMVRPEYPDAIFVPTHVINWDWTIKAAKNPEGAWDYQEAVALPSYTGPTETAQFPVWTKNVTAGEFEEYIP